MPKRKVNRSADSGEFVSKEEAKENPKETITEEVGKDEVIESVPEPVAIPIIAGSQLNTKYLFTHTKKDLDFVAEILSFEPYVVRQHFIKNLCQSTTEFEIENPKNYEIEEISKEELAVRLS